MTLVTMRTRAILTPIRGCRARRGAMHPYRPYLHKKKPRLSAGNTRRGKNRTPVEEVRALPIVLPIPTVDERGNTNHAPIVYYITSELGGVVKIGTTMHYEKRMRRLMAAQPALRPVLLAYEFGDQRAESERHRQFGRSRMQGEWFWMTPDLVAHIRTLGGSA